MKDYNINHLIKPYLGKTIHKKDRKTSLLLLGYFEKLPFFKAITRNHPNHWKIIHTNIFMNIVFQQFEPNKVIFNYGEDIPGIYIIIDGKVNIYYIKKEYDKNLNASEILNDNKNKFDIYENFVFSHQLMNGNEIGEECFKYNKKKIYFVATAASKCILGFLSKENYEKIFSKPNNLEQNRISSFLIYLKYFNESFITKKLHYYIYKKFYEKDSYIFKQDSKFNTFYIIYKGSINILLKLEKTVKCLIDKEFLLGNNSKFERFTFSRNHELRGKYKEINNFNIITYEEGEIIGGIEFMKNINKYLYSAKCLTDVEIICFNIKNFLYFDKIKQSKNFKAKINEQINYLIKRIKDIKNNTKNSIVFSRHNKFVKTFLENHKNNEMQKNKYLYNVFDNRIKKYKPKNFNKMRIRPFSAFIKNSIKYNSCINNKTKKKRNSFSIKYNRIQNISQRTITPYFNINTYRNNNIFKFNYTEFEKKPKNLKKAKSLTGMEEIKKYLSNQENNSITTNIRTKSSYILPDKYNSEGYNSFSSYFFFTDKKQKQINRYKKLSFNQQKRNKYTNINLFKENKKNKIINNRYSGVKKLFVIRDKYNEKNHISNILRNMFFLNTK